MHQYKVFSWVFNLTKKSVVNVLLLLFLPSASHLFDLMCSNRRERKS
jgi:hypothetical protein